MNKILLPLLTCFVFATEYCLTAQDVSVEFSVFHKNSVQKDSTTDYLQIKYCNRGQVDYYLPSLFYSTSEMPFFVTVFSRYHPDTRDKNSIQDRLKHFDGRHCYLNISFFGGNEDDPWILFSSPDDEPEAIETLNWDLCSYYILKGREPISFESYKSLGNIYEIQYSPGYVFLKSGETIYQYVDMSGPAEAGLLITISLEEDIPPSFIRLGYNYCIALPEIINGHQLYKDKIVWSETSIDFGH